MSDITHNYSYNTYSWDICLNMTAGEITVKAGDNDLGVVFSDTALKSGPIWPALSVKKD